MEKLLEHYCTLFPSTLSISIFQCLLVLWQLLEDWLALMDLETKTKPSTDMEDDQPPKIVTGPETSSAISKTLADNPSTEQTTAVQENNYCSNCEGKINPQKAVLPSHDGKSLEETVLVKISSPGVPNVCALIRAFYLCSQNSSLR